MLICSTFSQIFLPCSSESRWYQILIPYRWWPTGFLSQIPLMANLPWLFQTIMAIKQTILTIDILQFLNFVLQTLCYLLFGKQSIKDIPILWVSKVLNEIQVYLLWLFTKKQRHSSDIYVVTILSLLLSFLMLFWVVRASNINGGRKPLLQWHFNVLVIVSIA